MPNRPNPHHRNLSPPSGIQSRLNSRLGQQNITPSPRSQHSRRKQPLKPPPNPIGEITNQLLTTDRRVHRGQSTHKRQHLDIQPALGRYLPNHSLNPVPPGHPNLLPRLEPLQQPPRPKLPNPPQRTIGPAHGGNPAVPQPEPLAQLTFQVEIAPSRIIDLNPNNATFPRRGEHPRHTGPAHLQRSSDLVL
jgi:hypothetical protein